MIVKSCPKGCDPEDRLDIYNFHDEGFKFCPMCGTQLNAEERPDPESKPFKPVTMDEMVKTLREVYHPEMRMEIDTIADFLNKG